MNANVETKKMAGRVKVKSNPLFTSTLRTVKYTVLGKEINEGILFKAFLYTIFIATSYIYLNPILKMLVNMVMTTKDLVDPTITWIPSKLYFGHLETAWEMLDYSKSFLISMTVALCAAVFHCISTGLAGYALARLNFPFKKVVFGLLLLAFIIPPQVIVLPTIVAFRSLGLDNSIFTLIIPSMFGFGVKGALFVIIFRQFFLTQPKELEEAAKIDGATAITFYLKVMLPLAKPAILVVFLFSFVWTWNDTYLPQMFLADSKNLPLASELLQMDRVITSYVESQKITSFEGGAIKMAASFLAILPPLLIFMFFQRHFVEGVERTGLVE
ncbi:carbohydrate ABC transporter permease [Neobacillus kokaensis]|uniref:Transporter n=1 Tax=Neobacillus kokaensis TaxID=2759023 RepID=A0ABQ3MZE5_9BACI|nr:carbohydrate ABC transporter permease [Neobacillus kokaensis]GHH97802.1 transporter [Neobacillus kokaensis]